MAVIDKPNLTLQQLYAVPDTLLSAKPDELQLLLKQPTLLHLIGQHDTTLFISVLLHGNETTGFYAVQRLLKKYHGQTLPRNLSIFFGNISAAQQGVRRLENQADYNRIWPGTELDTCAEVNMGQQIVDIMRNHKLFASVDIHNNTGLNPHYACINKLDSPYQQLARLFSRLVVYFTKPTGVQSSAFAELCPSVTLECGRPDQNYGADHALDFIDSCLHLDHFPEHEVHPHDIDIFHTVAQVKIMPDTDFSFTRTDTTLLLDSDLEKMNFFEVPAGTAIGQLTNGNLSMPIHVKNERGEEVADHFFEIKDKELRFKRQTMPSMMTLNEEVISQDCLCYLMERLQS